MQTLIYDDSGFKKEMAENINANLEALGFRNAGVDIRPNLVVLNSTRMPALLVEAGFIDSDKDNQLFDSRSRPWPRPSPTASWRLWRSRLWLQSPPRRPPARAPMICP
ncbi:MAG: N-acetylmuramoyl-L-alanine amidase [Eubacteriales bacterium]